MILQAVQNNMRYWLESSNKLYNSCFQFYSLLGLQTFSNWQWNFFTNFFKLTMSLTMVKRRSFCCNRNSEKNDKTIIQILFKHENEREEWKKSICEAMFVMFFVNIHFIMYNMLCYLNIFCERWIMSGETFLFTFTMLITGISL